MKHRIFFIRLVNLAAIVALIGIYQGVVVYRSQQAQIAKLTAESKTYQSQISQLQKEVASASESSGSSSSEGDSGSEGSSSGYDFKDGTYTGSAQGFGGTITLSVKIAGGKIDSITIKSASGEDPSYFNQAKAIIQDMIDAQSPDVDTISGATYSSTGIKNAVIKALQKAQ